MRWQAALQLLRQEAAAEFMSLHCSTKTETTEIRLDGYSKNAILYTREFDKANTRRD